MLYEVITLVAAGHDDLQLDFESRVVRFQYRLDMFGLPKGQFAAARCDDESLHLTFTSL